MVTVSNPLCGCTPTPIGFSEAGFDEAVFAKKVAAALGTDHTELYVSPADALEVIVAKKFWPMPSYQDILMYV